MSEKTYYVFIRSARNWEEFAKARKRVIRRGLTYSEAQAFCAEWNRNRTPAQESRGTKAEFTS